MAKVLTFYDAAVDFVTASGDLTATSKISKISFGYDSASEFGEQTGTLVLYEKGKGGKQTPINAKADTVTSVALFDSHGEKMASLSGVSIPYFIVDLALNSGGGGGGDSEDKYAGLISLLNGALTVKGSKFDDPYLEVGGDKLAMVSGGDGDDILRVWHERDVKFDGGNGSDTIEFRSYFEDTPGLASGATIDLGKATAANPYGGTLTLTKVENVIGTSFADILTGNAENNRLDGGAGGNDTLHGEDGDDTIAVSVAKDGAQQTLDLDGGKGEDTLFFDIFWSKTEVNVLDLVDPDQNTGAFEFATISGFEIYRLGDPLKFSNAVKVDFRGSADGETVFGSTGDDKLDGRGGNDVLAGGRGVDTISGGEGDDTLYNRSPGDNTPGPATTDKLFGGNGDDTLVSFRGADEIDGGGDTDLAILERRGPTVGLTLDLSDPSILQALGDGTTMINVEQIDIIAGDGDDKITGGNLDDRIDAGFKGDSTLKGGGGKDSLTAFLGANNLDGGAGDDTIQTAVSDIGTPNPADVVDGGADTDHLILDASSYTGGLTIDLTNPAVLQTLGEGTTIVNIERLTLTPGDAKDVITGAALADTIGFSFVSNNGDDVFDGGGGNDVLFGGLGADTLTGGADDDRLNGGAGRDVLKGDGGIDRFEFYAASDSEVGADHDIIVDFVRGEDIIDLDNIDASKASGIQDFKWISSAKFHKKKGELHYVKKDGYVLLEGDTNGDGKADFQIELTGLTKLDKADLDL